MISSLFEHDLFGKPASTFRIMLYRLLATRKKIRRGNCRLREAMAQAVKSPEVIRTFETAGSPVAYMDAPEFSKFVEADSARLVAAVKRVGRVE
jgi:tripartite-type tricarboxylate transporter receptor subunit TctC